jgi:sugar/nucleoside kinase (ribokinase family)
MRWQGWHLIATDRIGAGDCFAAMVYLYDAAGRLIAGRNTI